MTSPTLAWETGEEKTEVKRAATTTRAWESLTMVRKRIERVDGAEVGLRSAFIEQKDGPGSRERAGVARVGWFAGSHERNEEDEETAQRGNRVANYGSVGIVQV
jgi:hypothetical protein